MAYTTINKSSDYFETELWSSVDTSIDTLNFQPDFAWIKSRTNADSHVLFDAVRGANKRLTGASTSAESTTSDELTAFNSNGYTLGTGANVNRSGHNYVSWNWLAGGTASSNTDGSITSNVSANTTSGFSIVSYTGTGSNATVGHGLGSAPKMMIVKNRDDVENWEVYHESLGNGNAIRLNLTDASFSTSGRWNNTSPTSSVFSLGITNAVNGSSDNMIAYCFAEKKGFSKFGSYNGNNNATDGAFIYTGFKPAFLLVKDSQSGQYWHMFDSIREPFNDDDAPHLSPNNSGSEATIRTDRGVAKLDFLSNGFKWRTDNSGFNGTNKYIYMAFAESPLVGTNNIPATAK